MVARMWPDRGERREKRREEREEEDKRRELAWLSIAQHEGAFPLLSEGHKRARIESL